MCSLIGWKKQLVQTSCILKKMISVLRIDIDRNRADAYEIVANGTMPDRRIEVAFSSKARHCGQRNRSDG